MEEIVKLRAGTMVPNLGLGQWNKLNLWRMTEFSQIVYLDADVILTSNVDELLSPYLFADSSATFAAVGSYFAGAVFVVKPDVDVFEEMMMTIEREGGKYLYGEVSFFYMLNRQKVISKKTAWLTYLIIMQQDFLNHFFRGGGSGYSRETLKQDVYHCLAEDFGHFDRLSNPTSTCKIVEFASCDRGGKNGGKGWKPWDPEDKLREEGALICRRQPTDMFWELVSFWRNMLQLSEIDSDANETGCRKGRGCGKNA